MKNALVYTHPKSKAAKAYKQIAAHLTGDAGYKERRTFLDWLFG
jgi:MinD-like ATPase involved in chromosome partitioning or flagellar assembly